MVLILIVVDNGLVLKISVGKNGTVNRLNPYCSGQWSRTILLNILIAYKCYVLILIVVDNGLVLDLIRLY